ncbi:MAG TPA: protein-arginine deiminase family protein, partial [Oligoflexus sp.]|uniref:protein-arginine deiminase family protein n=1 Tax=Oligoflexus sp. TaxID=1971216 RepID=UPI002D696266
MTEALILKKENIVRYSKLIQKKTYWNIAKMTVLAITLVHCKSTHSDISSQKVNPSSDFLTLSKNSCLNAKPDIKSLLVPDVKKLGYAQWCPSGKGFRTLPETHPLLGIFITDESYITYEQWPLAKKLLEIFKRRLNPPVINVLVQKLQLEKARTNASQYISAEDMKRLNFISIEGNDPSSVPQDLMEFGVTGTSPGLALLDLPHFDGGWEYAPGDIAKDCGFKLEKQSESPSDSGGEYGGNVIGLPGGLVAIGSGMNDSTVATISPDSQENVVRVNTEWLGVGHIDEFMVTVPTRDSAPCNFAILRASPALGLDLARTVGKSKDDRLEPQWPASEIFQAEPSTRTDCLAKLPRARNGKPLGAREALECPLFVKANETYEKIIDTEVSTLVARVKAATD